MKGFSIRYAFLVLALFFLSLLITNCEGKQTKNSQNPRFVKAIQIKSQQQLVGRAFHGLAKATQEVNLAFEVSGTLIEKPVLNGEKVKKDQLIARLDPHDFEATLLSAKAKLENTSRNFARAQELIKGQYISQMEFDKLQTELDVAKSNYALAEKALADSVLRAPFAGEIATTYVKNYQTVQAKQPIARLLDVSSIEMDINIPETLISYAKQVVQLKVTFDAFPHHPINAVIKEISGEASSMTRTYKVTLAMQQPQDITILPGMAGSAVVSELRTSEKISHFVIPSQAIVSGNNNQYYVWVINPDTQVVSRREITLGPVEESGIAVDSGLKAGEWVAIAGTHSLHPGEKVKILNPSQR